MYIWFIALTVTSSSRRPYPASFLTTEPFFLLYSGLIFFLVWSETRQSDISGKMASNTILPFFVSRICRGTSILHIADRQYPVQGFCLFIRLYWFWCEFSGVPEDPFCGGISFYLLPANTAD